MRLRRGADEALAVGRRTQPWDAAYAYRTVLFTVRREQGRLDEIANLIERSVGEYQGYRQFRCLFALTHCELGKRERGAPPPRRNRPTGPRSNGSTRPGSLPGSATFETATPTWAAWDSSHHPGHRLVALDDGEVVGWAALSPVSTRPCYAGVAENSVYVAPGRQGRGIGQALLGRLVADAEAAGIWTIQTGIFPDNEASIALHRRCGFRIVGVRVALAQLDGVWRDVVFMERRSEVIR